MSKDLTRKEKNILMVGGGGHCHSVCDAVKKLDEYKHIGIVERLSSDVGKEKFNVKVVGVDEDLEDLYNAGWKYAIITIGSIGDTGVREKVYKELRRIGFILPVIIDSSACIADDVIIGDGSYVGKNAVVNAGTSIGACSIINTGAVIEHDCTIGDFCHISSGAVLCGTVSIGKSTHVGAGSSVRQEIVVGEESIIGIGSVVVKDIPDKVTAYGNPCKVQK